MHDYDTRMHLHLAECLIKTKASREYFLGHFIHREFKIKYSDQKVNINQIDKFIRLTELQSILHTIEKKQ